MDQKLSLLTALYFHQTNNVQLSEDVVEDTKALLSLFIEEIISDEEYQQLLDSCLETGQLLKMGKRLYVSRSGESLVEAINERLLGQTNVVRLKEIIQSYAKDKRVYLKNVNLQLNSLHDRREQKVKNVDPDLVRAMGFLISLNYKQEHLVENYFELPPQMLRQEDMLTSEINYSAKKLTQKTGLPIFTQRMDNGFKFFTFIKLNSAKVFGQKLSPSSFTNVPRTEIEKWNDVVVSNHIEQCLRPLGYVQSRSPGRTFTNYREVEKLPTNIGILRESPSFNVDYTLLNNDNVFLWLNSYVSPSMRVLDFLEHNSAEDNEQKSLILLRNLKLRVLPSGSEVELLKILAVADLTKEQVPDDKITYAQYWENALNIPLTKMQQPLLVVKGFSRELYYPAEMVYLDKYTLEKQLREAPSRRIKTSSPEKRFNFVQDLYFSIKNSASSHQKRFVDIVLERYTPSAFHLIEHGAVESVVRIRPPMLEFDNGEISSDPSHIFRDDFAPICGKKNLSISHIIAPSFLSNSNINIFVQRMKQWFGSYKFGSISKNDKTKIIHYDLNTDISVIENKIRDLESTSGNNNIAIGIVPNQGNQHYYAFKRLFPMRTETPIQSIRLETFNDVVNNRFRGSKILCLKILVKSLTEGEIIWRLSNSAGLLQERSLYLGIGFSRYPREGRVSKCAAVLHDSHGSKVSWRIFSTTQDRTITKQWFDTLLRRTQDVIQQENPTRLVIYRTGTLYSGEKEIIQKSISNFTWLSKFEITFVSILDGSNYRLYTYDKRVNKYGNLPAGYAAILNEKEALLSTSNYDERELRQGTVVPVKLKIEFGNSTIIDVLKEYHDQTYVNWLAPFTTSKTPFVTTVANKFAELTREGISPENLFYLDL